MLAEDFVRVRMLRLTGAIAEAIGKAGSIQPASDEDAFELVACGFAAEDSNLVGQASAGWRWRSSWAAAACQAVQHLMARNDRAAALHAAGLAINGNRTHPDVCAIYLQALLANGRVAEAHQFIREAGALPPPAESWLLTSIAEIATVAGDWPLTRSAALLSLATNPRNFRTALALSVAAHETGSRHEALAYARQAHLLAPNVPLTAYQYMRCLNACGDFFGALAVRERARALAPFPPILDEAGHACVAIGMRERAVDAYQESLALGSRSVEALRALLRLYLERQDQRAIDALCTGYAVEIAGDIDALFVLGLNALFGRDRTCARAYFEQSAALTLEPSNSANLFSSPVSEAHVRHDLEQLALLSERAKLDAEGEQALAALRAQHARTRPPAPAYALDTAAGQELRAALSRCHYRPDPAISGPALAQNDYADFQRRFAAQKLPLLVIDNFLSADALAALRQFCEEATVFKSPKPGGYQGAFLSGGFCSDVLLAIADELRSAMPDLVGPHPLTQAWAFKYDQDLSGIVTHADFARVNLNFWITPQDACIDGDTGGLLVYDIPAPKGWTFQDYNAESDKIAAFLTLHGAKATRIPYRENRCVLFDSTLFHATDECHFKPGYAQRRVNVTMLFGNGLVSI